MIARKPPKTFKGKSDFRRLTHYITRQFNENEVSGYKASNCNFEDPRFALQEIRDVQARNTRTKTEKTYHLVVAFPPGENPTIEQLEDIEKELCQSIGYQNHQRISALHNDKDHLHLHIAINKIHPKSFNCLTPKADFKKLNERSAALEIKHSLTQVCALDKPKDREKSYHRSDDMKAHSGQQPFSDWITENKEAITQTIDQAESWDDVHQNLAKFDLTIRQRGRGMVISARHAKAFIKMSEVGREYSTKKLTDRLGLYRAASEAAEKIIPAQQYSKASIKPLRSQQDNTLWNDFQARKESKSIALADIRLRRSAGYQRLKLENQQRKAAIKADRLMNGPQKRLAYQKLSATMKKARTAHKQAMAAQQSAVYTRHPERNWNSYLMTQAEQGHETALKLLRQSRKNNYLAKQLALSGEQQADSNTIIAAMKPSVSQSGVVEYRYKGHPIRDDGRTVATDSRDKAALLALLRIAQQRYGKQLSVTSEDDKFKQALIEVAVSEGLKITFDDPVLERKRQVLKAAVSDEREKERGKGPVTRSRTHNKTRSRAKSRGIGR